MLIIRIEYLDGTVAVVGDVRMIEATKPNKLEYQTKSLRVKDITDWAKVTVRAENGFPLEEYVSEAFIEVMAQKKKQNCYHRYTREEANGNRFCTDCNKELVHINEPECGHSYTRRIGMSRVCTYCSAVVERFDNSSQYVVE